MNGMRTGRRSASTISPSHLTNASSGVTISTAAGSSMLARSSRAVADDNDDEDDDDDDWDDSEDSDEDDEALDNSSVSESESTRGSRVGRPMRTAPGLLVVVFDDPLATPDVVRVVDGFVVLVVDAA